MSMTFVPDAGEEVLFHGFFQPSPKVPPFAVAVTRQGIHLLKKRLFAVSDPWFFERLPLSQVQEVSIRRVPPYPLWALAVLMVLGGAAVTYLSLGPALEGRVTKATGYGPALLVAGAVLPFILRGRWVLTIRAADRSHRWKPPLLVDAPSRERAQRLQDGVLEACRAVGVRVVDERG